MAKSYRPGSRWSDETAAVLGTALIPSKPLHRTQKFLWPNVNNLGRLQICYNRRTSSSTWRWLLDDLCGTFADCKKCSPGTLQLRFCFGAHITKILTKWIHEAATKTLISTSSVLFLRGWLGLNCRAYVRNIGFSSHPRTLDVFILVKEEVNESGVIEKEKVDVSWSALNQSFFFNDCWSSSVCRLFV